MEEPNICIEKNCLTADRPIGPFFMKIFRAMLLHYVQCVLGMLKRLNTEQWMTAVLPEKFLRLILHRYKKTDKNPRILFLVSGRSPLFVCSQAKILAFSHIILVSRRLEGALRLISSDLKIFALIYDRLMFRYVGIWNLTNLPMCCWPGKFVSLVTTCDK